MHYAPCVPRTVGSQAPGHIYKTKRESWDGLDTRKKQRRPEKGEDQLAGGWNRQGDQRASPPPK